MIHFMSSASTLHSGDSVLRLQSVRFETTLCLHIPVYYGPYSIDRLQNPQRTLISGARVSECYPDLDLVVSRRNARDFDVNPMINDE